MLEDKEILVNKFLNNECSEEEYLLVQEILLAEPHLLDNYLTKKEWDNIHLNAKKSNHAIREEIWQQVLPHTKRTVPLPQRLFIKTAVAACILLMVGRGIYFTARKKTIDIIANNHQSILNSLHSLNNNTDTICSYILSDGSGIAIYPHSSMRFKVDYEDRRTVQLVSGKVEFTVAKDKTKPFTVYTGTSSTTALGTKFLIDNSDEKVVIRLIEGKVLIKKEKQNLAGWRGDTILFPGQELSYNKIQKRYAVNAFEIAGVVDLRYGQEKGLKLHKINNSIKKTNLHFDNTPLEIVFRDLADMYSKEIHYKKEEIGGMFFSGKVLPTDNPKKILQIIGMLNGLSVKETKNGYEIICNKPVTRE